MEEWVMEMVYKALREGSIRLAFDLLKIISEE